MSKNPAFAPINGSAAPKAAAKPAKAPNFVSVMPVPEGGPAPLKRHPAHGEPVRSWPYLDADGRLLGYACRFDKADGSKTYQPLTLFRETATDALKWKWKGWAEPRPLYGLDRLAARPSAPVFLCEGEKAADAAGDLVPDYIGVTSPNGSKSAGKADWSALRGRRVVIWPDADAPGLEYASAATALILAAGAASVSQIELPVDAAEGWDAADALAEGWELDRALQLVANAKPVTRPYAQTVPTQPSAPQPTAEAEEGGKHGPGRPAWHETLLALTDDYELWHTPKKATYASVVVEGGHRENWSLRSDAFLRHLRLKAHEETGRIPSKANLEETIGLLEARAVAYGPCRKEWLRVGRQDGNFYLDLGCDRWRAVEISPRGVQILETHSLPFVRPEGLHALPEPELGSERGIDELRPFVNVATDEEFHLIVAWTLAALCSADEFPLLILNGEQGTGKSTLSRLLRSIIDPHAAAILSPPKEDRDLFVLAQHTHIVALDNLSKVENWMSDSLCILATGGAMASRSMYTDASLTILEATRPVILNGIPALAERPDLAERSITVQLRPVPEEERRTSADIKRDWEAARPRILGTFLEAISTGLREVERIKIDKLPRMAGFARFMVASAPGLGLDGQALYDAYKAMLSALSNAAFDNNPVANALVKMMDAIPSGEWRGTPTELLEALSDPEVTPDRIRNGFAWPKSAQGIGSAMARIAPTLRARGIDARSKHSGKTYWEIRRT